MNARILQSDPTVAVKSTAQPDITREVRPAKIATRPAIDEKRKKNAHEFDRSGFRDRIRMLSMLPTMPKTKMKIDRYRLS
jgi:hypothetical protein